MVPSWLPTKHWPSGPFGRLEIEIELEIELEIEIETGFASAAAP